MGEIQLQIGLEVIRSYKRLSYEPWYALAEFVDNSVQSYRDHRGTLDELYERERKEDSSALGLRVTISYDRDSDIIVVRDNAMGMNTDELERAMHIGKPPADPSGLSQFGLGLKTAACWFGDYWSIRTSKFGEKIAHMLTIDVEAAASSKAAVLPYESAACDPSEHYTEIRIERLHHKLRTRRLSKTKDMLKSMYQVEIRDGHLELQWDSSILGWTDNKTLFRHANGRRAKKSLAFTVRKKTVSGWVGVLGPGSASRKKAGFALIRRGRLIRGWPHAWRPDLIFGAAQGRNDLINQRLTGELHLDEFDVTHTKDDILWREDEEDLIQEHLKKKAAPLIDLARSYRKPAPELSPDPLALVASLRDGDLLLRVRNLIQRLGDDMGSEVPTSILAETHRELLAVINKEEPILSARTRDSSLVHVRVTKRVDSDAPWVLVGSDGPERDCSIAINSAHPIFAFLHTSRDREAVLEQAVVDGLLLWAVHRGKLDATAPSIIAAKDMLIRRLIGDEDAE